MKRRDPGLDPALKAFLEARTIERRVPADLRARVLARSRAIVAAGGAIPRPLLLDLPAAMPVPPGRRWGLFRIAFAASIAFAAGSVGAVAALRSRASEAPPPTSEARHAVPVARDVRVRDTSGTPPAAAVTEPATTAKATRPARGRLHAGPAHAGPVDPITAELDLLQRAHAAYTTRAFSDALTLVAEHARRFPSGHLAEQREALRVRSLASSGRAEEAHRAAAAFAVRFPRSVLLPRLEL